MPKALINGVNLYYEETGTGTPVVFVHEFAGDYRSWEPQVRYFSRRYRCITYNARGFPPSDVPESHTDYSQEHAVGDLLGLLDHLGLDQAHIVGFSMGGFCSLIFGLKHPQRALSLVVAGCGYGSDADRSRYVRDVEEIAAKMIGEGMEVVAEFYARGPTRVQFIDTDGNEVTGITLNEPVTISLTVPTADLFAANQDPQSVAVFKAADPAVGPWNELATTFTFVDGGYKFTAQTFSFSTFKPGSKTRDIGIPGAGGAVLPSAGDSAPTATQAILVTTLGLLLAAGAGAYIRRQRKATSAE